MGIRTITNFRGINKIGRTLKGTTYFETKRTSRLRRAKDKR